MRVLGIDFAIETGVHLAYVDVDDPLDAELSHIAFPRRKPTAQEHPSDFATRCLRRLRLEWPGAGALEDHGVSAVAIEDPMSAFAHTAKTLGRIYGAVVVLCPTSLEITSLDPQTWKEVLTGKPSATKGEVQLYVTTELGWRPDPELVGLTAPYEKQIEHYTDAYGIARAAIIRTEREERTA